MARAFVIRPFGVKQDSAGNVIDFDRTQAELIDPALKAAGIAGGTTGEIIDSGNIRADMFALIVEADVVVCDMTVLNANVFYELGIRHALRKKWTILIKAQPSGDETPFDLLTDRYLVYPVEDPGAVKGELVATLNASLASERETDSPIFQMMPGLAEADASTTQIVPMDFREEVARAATAKRKGWLRLLSEEVRPRRFVWEGLKLVASAQWEVKDYVGARQSWEALRNVHRDDVHANLALANIYERLYREETDPEWIEKSDQAIERVLNGDTASRTQQAEALTLKGRNEKTRWRLSFETGQTTEERRRKALSRAPVLAYEAFEGALLQDLNHFYAGLNALQIATILLDLSADEEAWMDIFDTDEEAEATRAKLETHHASLREVVPLAVEGALARLSESDPERLWAKVSEADLLFLLNGDRKRRIVNAYRAAIPREKAFAWDAVRGQLGLFADIGFKEELAREVVQALDAHFEKEGDSPKPLHVVVFAGHRVDGPARESPRFPPSREEHARSLIREEMQKLVDEEHEVVALGSAAPGTDILAHEVCDELGIPSTICLPMPEKDTARLAFDGLDGWRNRFLELKAKHDVFTLSDQEGLPRWLEGSRLDPWERANRWVMKMAQTWGAAKVSLVALWDGKPAGDAAGGTAQVVKLAEDSGTVHVKKIDANQLLDSDSD